MDSHSNKSNATILLWENYKLKHNLTGELTQCNSCGKYRATPHYCECSGTKLEINNIKLTLHEYLTINSKR